MIQINFNSTVFLSCFRLCENRQEDFDPYLNMKQLQETLACLIRIYKENPAMSTKEKSNEQKIQFTFDLDDDEDEFFVTDSVGGEGQDIATDSDESLADSNRREEHSSAHRNGGNLPQNGPLQEDVDAVNTLLNRIRNMELTNSTENPTQDASNVGPLSDLPLHRDQQLSAKDIKNRENKYLEETAKECSSVKWTNVVDMSNTAAANNCTSEQTMNNTSVLRNGESHLSSESEQSNTIEENTKLDYCEREELECLYLLLNYEQTEVMQHGLELAQEVKDGPLLSKVLPALLNYHSTGNFVSLMRLFNVLPPVLCCALYLNLPKLQKRILQVLSTGHSSGNTRYIVSDLPNLLMIPEVSAVKELCQYYGLKLAGDETQFVAFHKKDFLADKPVVRTR